MVFSRSTALCGDEGGNRDGKVGSRAISDSEPASDDASRDSLPHSLLGTGVAFLRPTTLCGDDGGDRKANRDFICA